MLPMGYVGARQVWVMWSRWDCYQRTIYEFAQDDKRLIREDPSDDGEAITWTRKDAESSRRLTIKLQRAVWTPRFWFTLFSRVPYPERNG
jgi:hypothetical protein